VGEPRIFTEGTGRGFHFGSRMRPGAAAVPGCRRWGLRLEWVVPNALAQSHCHLGAASRVSGLVTVRSTLHWKQRGTKISGSICVFQVQPSVKAGSLTILPPAKADSWAQRPTQVQLADFTAFG